jgi:HEPN domain-containing protein
MNKTSLINSWFNKADGDYLVAGHLFDLHPVQVDIICFHCQQAVEKWLKGYLVSVCDEEPPYTHDLTRLMKLCLAYDSRFEALDLACQVLSQYGVVPRYPDEYEVTELQARRAYELAGQIRESEMITALSRMKEHES